MAGATLLWFTGDLRIRDNPCLHQVSADRALACVTVIDPAGFRTDRYGNRRMGEHRWRFLRESLLDLSNSLAALGQNLHLLEGDAVQAISGLLDTGEFARVVRSRQHAVDEVAAWEQLRRQYPHIRFDEFDTATLFAADSLDCLNDPEHGFPATFSRFRRQVSDSDFRSLSGPVVKLPGQVSLDIDDRLIKTPTPGIFQGGESAALQHLDEYFASSAPSTYKETRNQFEGERYSTCFSPWLADGSLSPLTVAERLVKYEQTQGANESTGWILFELLWREYFKWYAAHHRHRLFRFAGLNQKGPLTSFYGERFRKWCQGQTPWPIVNACMNELNATGFIGNRARQIVASCLVNELGLDWRCGAGYFEQQLIDYDPCSNWGNWQYIAGVGADARGGRHFDLTAQAETWDPSGDYRERWAGEVPTAPLDSVDYYDWPVATDADGPS